jgi:kynureninase
MEPAFRPMRTVEAWQVSNAPVLSMAVHRVALQQFDRVGMAALRAKSERLTGYMEFVVNNVARSSGAELLIITPKNPEERGCQLSVCAPVSGRALFEELTRRGVVLDWREPDVLRLAPVPLYNRFEEVWAFGNILKECMACA